MREAVVVLVLLLTGCIYKTSGRRGTNVGPDDQSTTPTEFPHKRL